MESIYDPLQSSIPPSLFRAWTAMAHLDMSHSQLIGSIPSEVGFMSNLTSLTLSYNSLSGPVPSALGGLAASGVLTSLDLDGNAFSGSLDPRLLNLLGLCTSTSTASSLGSPGLAYTCPGASSSPSSSPTSSAVMGGAVGGAVGGALLLLLLLVVVWHVRQRRSSLKLSSSSTDGGASLELGASNPGKSAAGRQGELTPESVTRSGRGLQSKSRQSSTPASSSIKTLDNDNLSSEVDILRAWQCGHHDSAAHDAYLW